MPIERLTPCCESARLAAILESLELPRVFPLLSMCWRSVNRGACESGSDDHFIAFR